MIQKTKQLCIALSLCWVWATAMAQPGPVLVGAERMDQYLPLLKDKQVGVVVNHTSMVGQVHLVDTLCKLDLCVARIFAPEHGFRGEVEAGDNIRDGQDLRTGVPIVSLYGKKKKPSADDLAGLDVVIFDIQDVGARFYTYISTMFYLLEACSENGVPVIILDRPNPNGHYVDGPVLDMRLESFIGIAPLPVVHGCTVGELALMFTGECWINCPEHPAVTVIPCLNYTHHTPYDLPVKPSPNIPDMRSVLLYPSLCFFEGTSASVGRGTDTPFQLFGHPDFASDSFWFVPRPNAGSKSPPQKGWICKGVDLRNLPIEDLRKDTLLELHWLLDFYRDFPNKPVFFLSNGMFDLLAGTSELRKQMEAGKTEAEIRVTWAEDLNFFKAIRKKYLLYP
jgi:uncharacterized protein YbbC (DUF1343 family)